MCPRFRHQRSVTWGGTTRTPRALPCTDKQAVVLHRHIVLWQLCSHAIAHPEAHHRMQTRLPHKSAAAQRCRAFRSAAVPQRAGVKMAAASVEARVRGLGGLSEHACAPLAVPAPRHKPAQCAMQLSRNKSAWEDPADPDRAWRCGLAQSSRVASSVPNCRACVPQGIEAEQMLTSTPGSLLREIDSSSRYVSVQALACSCRQRSAHAILLP